MKKLLAVFVVFALSFSMFQYSSIKSSAITGNLASAGTIIVSTANPAGGGNKDIEVIRDGVKPASGTMDNTLQYDTYIPDAKNYSEYVGYTFGQQYAFTSVVFQEGMHFDNGGWFANGLKVQVRVNGEWTDVSYTASPVYPNSDSRDAFGSTYETYTFTFDATTGDGIRLYGTAGGAQAFISVAELEVYNSEHQPNPSTGGDYGVNFASSGTPVVSITNPTGGGNKDINVICDGVKPENESVENANQKQYDTFCAMDVHDDFVGYVFDGTRSFTRLVFQEGLHFDGGGWFANGSLKVQVRVNGEWTDVQSTCTPSYPNGNSRNSFGSSFEIYTFTFDKVYGDGIRLYGTAGGYSNFISVAELEVYSENQLTETELLDKLKGAWVGQMAGVTWGASKEFWAQGRTFSDSEIPSWSSSMINDAFGQDDLYVEVPFMEALNGHGLNCDVQTFGEYFKNTTFSLCHANNCARENLRNGIDAPDSGSYLYNQHCDDIDWQIEADFAGEMSPGLVNDAIALSWKAGHVVCYGDGVYGGVYVAAMHAKAYTADSIDEIIEAGRQSVPQGSEFREVIDDVMAWKESGKTWQETWSLLEEKWGNDDRCPEGSIDNPSFNIDAKMNAAYVLIGLLYGNGDFENSMKITMQCGQDSDCNPSTVGSILGNYMGLSNIPDKWKSALDYTGRKFAYTNYNFDDLINMNLNLAKLMLADNGAALDNGTWIIPDEYTVVAPELEQWPDQPSVSVTVSVNKYTATFNAKAYDKSGIQGYEWDFGDGTSSTRPDVTHTYSGFGRYEATCTVTNNSGASVQKKVQLIAGNNIASEGTPIVSITNPTGGGNKDIGVICDGDMPASESDQNAITRQYDTFCAMGAHDDYVGYTFDENKAFVSVVFQEGMQFADGGWFANGSLKLQVRQNGQWVDVPATVEPAYPNSNSRTDFDLSFGVYQFTFDKIEGDGIRLYGLAGGNSNFISVAELQAYEFEIPLASISLNKTSLTLQKGQSETLTVAYDPENTTDDMTVTWTSSDESVAAVADGVVTAMKAGTATITASAAGKTATCDITVDDPTPATTTTETKETESTKDTDKTNETESTTSANTESTNGSVNTKSTNSTKSVNTGKSTDTPKTGDSFPVSTLLLLVSLLVVVPFGVYQKKKNPHID
ncbi:MAG: ADP-ribosylglycohydrolase family protein [Eubacteriales bacterium]|nr:ADP-ribosylglycohydrolase family protein [Eubacteriales bacterium]